MTKAEKTTPDTKQDASSILPIDPMDAKYVLIQCVENGELTPEQVQSMIANKQNVVLEFKTQFENFKLRASALGMDVDNSLGTGVAQVAARRGRGKAKTAGATTSQQIQGRYLGAFRQLNGTQRKAVKKVFKAAKEAGKDGRVAALAHIKANYKQEASH